MDGKALNAWRVRLGFTITDAAKALGLSRGRLIDNLYTPTRPPSKATIDTARRIEAQQEGGGRHT